MADDVGKSARRMSDDIDKGSRDIGGAIDDSEGKFRGLGDTIGGTGDIMEGFKTGNVATMAMGFADLAGGISDFVIPALGAYLEQLPKPFMDGGYYARTPENRPLIGPLPVDGAYIIGGLGGFGMQASCGSADLLAQYILGRDLPSYGPAFRFDRYADPDYQKLLQNWGGSGQI